MLGGFIEGVWESLGFGRCYSNAPFYPDTFPSSWGVAIQRPLLPEHFPSLTRILSLSCPDAFGDVATATPLLPGYSAEALPVWYPKLQCSKEDEIDNFPGKRGRCYSNAQDPVIPIHPH